MAIGFSIPGNVKQRMLPFVIDPSKSLNKVGNDIQYRSFSSGDPGAIPQWFTFKGKTESPNSANIQLWPSTLNFSKYGMYFDKDISYKLVYAPEYTKETRLKFNMLVNQIPAVQIREYLPDTRFDQLVNLMTDLFAVITDMISEINFLDMFKTVMSGIEYVKRLSKKIGELLEVGYHYVVGDDTDNSLLFKAGEIRDMFSGEKGGDAKAAEMYAKIVSFPFAMYYKLQSYTTTNIYELPASLGDKVIYSSSGKSGWSGGKGVGLATLFDKDNFMMKIPVIGKMIENMVKNIKVHWMPLWDPDSGAQVQHPAVKITFDLFNDTAEAAAANFIFVNTLVPNNSFVQYGMFQHSSPLYDVRIEGFDRMFACSGNMQVEYLGVMRVPSYRWLKEFLKKHYNWDGRGGGFPSLGQFLNNAQEHNLIKIPDAYRVSMDFESMLPNSFNSYLFNWLENKKMETKYADSSNVVTGSLLSQNFMEELKDDFKAKLKQQADAINDEMKQIETEVKSKKDAEKEKEKAERKKKRDEEKKK